MSTRAESSSIGQNARELEQRIGSEAVAELGDNLRVAAVIFHDADGIEVLLDQEMDVLEHFRRATDRKSGAEGDGREGAGTEGAENAMALRPPPHPCGAR